MGIAIACVWRIISITVVGACGWACMSVVTRAVMLLQREIGDLLPRQGTLSVRTGRR